MSTLTLAVVGRGPTTATSSGMVRFLIQIFTLGLAVTNMEIFSEFSQQQEIKRKSFDVKLGGVSICYRFVCVRVRDSKLWFGDGR